MSFEDGLKAEVADGVAVLTMSNPGRRNAFYAEMRNRMRDRLREYASDASVRVVILTGDEGHFCSGADLKRVAGMTPPTVLQQRERMRDVMALLEAIVAGPKPVIAAVEGDAFGAGMSMAVGSDVVVASKSARFGAAFAKLSLLPDMGLLYTLPQRIGLPKAKRLMMTGQPISGEQAFDLGLADELVEPGQALARAHEIANELKVSAPLTMAMVKSVYAKGVPTLDAVTQLELDLVPLLSNSQDHKAALQAFLEKKTVSFNGA